MLANSLFTGIHCRAPLIYIYRYALLLSKNAKITYSERLHSLKLLLQKETAAKRRIGDCIFFALGYKHYLLKKLLIFCI